MSAFITVKIQKLNVNTLAKFKQELKILSNNFRIGVWFDEIYLPSVQEAAENNYLAFESADNNQFCNCEDLLIPWWCDTDGEMTFQKNIEKIQNIILFCLSYSHTVELYIGTAGDSYDDFFHSCIELSQLFFFIKHQYQSSPEVIPPSMHFIFHKPNVDGCYAL